MVSSGRAVFNRLNPFPNGGIGGLDLLHNATLFSKLFLSTAHMPVVDKARVLDELGGSVCGMTSEKEIVPWLHPPC